MVSIEEIAVKQLDNLMDIAKKCRSQNIPFVNKSFGPEWDSSFSQFFELIESNQELNGLVEVLTQCDIDTIDDEEFKHYEYAVPMYKTFTFKFIDLMLEISSDDEKFVNRTKVMLEEIKQKYGYSD